MKLRINKLISDAGLGSRRDVEEYIKRGRVKINGRVAHLGDMVSEEDTVFFDEVDLPVKELIRDHIAEEKRQRLQAAPKSAALRKGSKNNPENRQRHKARTQGWSDDEPELDEHLLRHRNSGRRGAQRTSQPTLRPRGRKYNDWED